MQQSKRRNYATGNITSVLKERHPKTNNIYCNKFKTGEANWKVVNGKEEQEGVLGAPIMFYILI